MKNIIEEIQVEFPATDNKELLNFMEVRGYTDLKDEYWKEVLSKTR
jgi:hypothetical protein